MFALLSLAALAQSVRGVGPPEAGLGEPVVLQVDDLAAAIAEAGDCASLRLFLDGEALTDLQPLGCDPDDGHVRFLLQRTDADDAVWHRVLGSPSQLTKSVPIGLGSSVTRSFPRAGDVRIGLRLLSPAEVVGFLVTCVAGIAGVGWLGRSTSLLRETSSPTFSLARVQQALWLVLAVLGYLFVWLVTNELNSMNTSILALIGISSGTALGSRLVNGSKTRALRDQLTRLEVDRSAAEAGAEVQALSRSAKVQAARLRAEAAGVERALQPPRSKGFLLDLVSDEGGASLQRVQIVVWTVILGTIFVMEVFRTLDMPVFDSVVLGVMGLSSGTFLAGKANENHVVPVSGAPAD